MSRNSSLRVSPSVTDVPCSAARNEIYSLMISRSVGMMPKLLIHHMFRPGEPYPEC
jgi:hypothetical protein